VSTPISNSTPYCTVPEFLARFDIRPSIQLLVDNGLTPPISDLGDTNSTAYANLQTLLADASGELELACFMGGRYAATDLAGLNGNSLAVMKRLVCNIAVRMLWERRQDGKPPPPQAQQAAQMLDLLAQGERVFAIQETVDATIMGTVKEQPGARPNDMRRVAWGFFTPSDPRRCG
jgi:phage gp36-like protein